MKECFGTDITIYVSWASVRGYSREYGLAVTSLPNEKFDMVAFIVARNEFTTIGITSLMSYRDIIYGVKNIFGNNIDGKLQ